MNRPSIRQAPLAILLLVASVAHPGLLAADADLDLFAGQKWAFYPGYEFPGAKGSVQMQEVDGKKAATLNYDFTGGGAYVMTGTRTDLAGTPKGIRFEVKGDRELKIVFRLEDSSGQTHQYQLLYQRPGEWQPLDVDLTVPPKSSFGGPKDGVIHFPLTKIWFGVGKGKTTAEPGEASFSSVRSIE